MLKTVKKYIRKEFVESNYPSFYLVNAIGWILLILIDTFIVSPELLGKFPILIMNTLQWGSGFLVTSYLRSIYKRYPYRNKSIVSILLFLVAISILASILFYLLVYLIGIPFYINIIKYYFEKLFSFSNVIMFMQRYVSLLTTWSLAYFGIKLWMDLKSEKERVRSADLLAQSAQLQMLRYQINPHFLFNSFSSLRALIRTNPSMAEIMLSKLSDFYRYTLVTKSNIEVPLIDEIEALSNYAEIEKIRFEDKIEFEFDIDSLAEDYPIPSFLIHPLVENAIKYGMKTSEMPLRIKISAKVEDKWLIIQVSNSGKLIDRENNMDQGTGTGLTNVKHRLEYSCPHKNKFEIFEEDGMVKAIIKILKEFR